MKIVAMLSVVFLAAATFCGAQSSQIDPTQQVNWLAATGSGAPSSGCPYAVTGVTYSVSYPSMTFTGSPTGLVPNMVVTGTAIPGGTYVTSVQLSGSVSSIGISANPTSNETGVTVNFYPVGRPYTDTTNNAQYVCSLGGWTSTASSGANVNGTSFSNSQSVSFSAGAAAGSGASIPICGATSTYCTPNYGIVLMTLGTSTTTGDLLTITWSTAFNHTAVCAYTILDATSSTAVTTLYHDYGSSSSTSAVLSVTSALTASHALLITYVCW